MRNLEITASTYIDGGVCCLSGRTAAYRTAILRDPDFQWKFTHEFWVGKYLQHSGDDKFLTRWMHSHSWKTFIQACPEAELLSTFKDNSKFLLQLLRWTRNTWRSDLRSVFVERYVWSRHPFVAFTMVDKFFNPFTLLAGPCTVIYVMTKGGPLPSWVILVCYLAWLLVTRVIKYMPHFVRRPQDVIYIPVWIVFNIYFVCLKLYCLCTLYVTDWGTRSGADDKNGENDISEIFVPHWDDDEEEENLDNEDYDLKGQNLHKDGMYKLGELSSGFLADEFTGTAYALNQVDLKPTGHDDFGTGTFMMPMVDSASSVVESDPQTLKPSETSRAGRSLPPVLGGTAHAHQQQHDSVNFSDISGYADHEDYVNSLKYL